jgi:hypothetical protein
MKNLTILVTLLSALGVNFISLGQDTLTFSNGTKLRAKVTEVMVTGVKYKKYDNLNGPLYTVLKSDLRNIKYENGQVDTFSKPVQAPISNSFNEPHASVKSLGYDRIKYNGPRVGLTFFGDGATKDELKLGNYGGWITQFGWQFESRIFTTDTGTSGLIEWVLLVGGVEKGLFKPSATMLFGIRGGKKGLEFGMGPNLSSASFGMAIAAGGSIKSGKVYFPINLAIVPSVNNDWNYTGERRPTGVRVSLLIGFNTRVQ